MEKNYLTTYMTKIDPNDLKVDKNKVISSLERRLTGYGYDSLCLRYMMAREAQMRAEIKEDPTHEEQHRKAAQRDMLRFYEIADDLIGEHD